MTRTHGDAVAHTEVIDAAIRHAGHDPADFDVQLESASDLNLALGLVGGLAVVRRLSVDCERLYAADRHAGWIAGFAADLERGLFGPPPAPVSAAWLDMPNAPGRPAAR